MTVTFSDGQTLAVPARAMAWRGAVGSGVENGNSAGPNPSPSPSPPTGFDARSTIQAEARNAQQGTTLETTTDTGGGQNAAHLANGDWLRFDGVRFNGEFQFKARVASGAAGGSATWSRYGWAARPPPHRRVRGRQHRRLAVLDHGPGEHRPQLRTPSTSPSPAASRPISST
ncbi:carbohydrate-binding protein [Acrocarpospora sp. B8E8]|uniref:carbohydrate-binding protein n=1 Tax=Acrocarpospora sp. B8E8 TaxID=3153572 RepID=UPI00325CC104